MNIEPIISEEVITNKIYIVRGISVMLGSDLAELYGVETKVLNQAVKRNEERFPQDFMFQLTENEWKSLRSQTVTSNGRGGVRYLPVVFTEQGVAMLSSVLNSATAIQVNIQIIRIFSKMRKLLLEHKEILLKLEKLEQNINKQAERGNKHEEEIQLIFKALKELLHTPQKPREQIGFKTKD